MSDLKKQRGRFLQRLRERHGKNYQQMDAALGFSERRYSKLEKGEGVLRDHEIQPILNFSHLTWPEYRLLIDLEKWSDLQFDQMLDRAENRAQRLYETGDSESQIGGPPAGEVREQSPDLTARYRGVEGNLGIDLDHLRHLVEEVGGLSVGQLLVLRIGKRFYFLRLETITSRPS